MSPKQYAIEAVDVAKYYGEVKALDGVSLKVEEGTIFGLLGPNGAGKTTLLNAMSTLIKPDQGSVKILGVDVLEHPNQVRKLIGLAGQFAAVDELLTGYENLYMVGRLYHLSKKEAAKRAKTTLEELTLADAGKRLVKTYSGGMRRRLDLGACLVGRPKVLFLDEPTTGLDPKTRLDLWAIIRQLVKDGTTILLTTQYLEEADELADMIAVIDHGKVIAEGTSDELKARMGGDVVELGMETKADAETALAAVAKASSKKPNLGEDGLTISAPVSNGPKDLMAIVSSLNEAKLTPASLSLHRPSLDDVFLSLTGKKVVEETPKSQKGRRKG